MGYSPVVDVHGRPVEVGTRVRVRSLPSGVIEKVEAEEVDRVLSMLGEVFEIDEIDEHGCAWVTKWWDVGPDEKDAHSLALSAENMEVV
jgi:hypothetical protein